MKIIFKILQKQSTGNDMLHVSHDSFIQRTFCDIDIVFNINRIIAP